MIGIKRISTHGSEFAAIHADPSLGGRPSNIEEPNSGGGELLGIARIFTTGKCVGVNDSGFLVDDQTQLVSFENGLIRRMF